MDARKIAAFIKSPLGMILTFMAGLLVVVLSAGRFSRNQSPVVSAQPAVYASQTRMQTQTSAVERPTPVQVAVNNTSSSRPNSDQEEAIRIFERPVMPLRGGTVQAPPPKPVVRATPAPTPVPVVKKPESMKIFAAASAAAASEQVRDERVNYRPAVRKFSQRYAPYGRLVKCELVNTLDSTKRETPIIGLVTEPVYWNKELIIPVGAEVHGTVATDRQNRERLASNERWVIVLPANNSQPHGAEMVVRGAALDMSDVRGDGRSWGITDGSYGIQGYTIKTANAEEVKLFVATFLSEAAQAFQTRQSTLMGSQLEATPQNAALNGTSAVLNKYAEEIMDQIKEYGSYTRVPAGKQFYVYIEQTLDAEDARIGDSDARIKQRQQERFGYDRMEEDPRGDVQPMMSPWNRQVYYGPQPPAPTTNPFVPGAIPGLPQAPSNPYLRSQQQPQPFTRYNP